MLTTANHFFFLILNVVPTNNCVQKKNWAPKTPMIMNSPDQHGQCLHAINNKNCRVRTGQKIISVPFYHTHTVTLVGNN